jgi:hypothetical protein
MPLAKREKPVAQENHRKRQGHNIHNKKGIFFAPTHGPTRSGAVCTTPLATTHWRFAFLNTDSHFTSEGTNARSLWRQWIVRSARDCNSSIM